MYLPQNIRYLRKKNGLSQEKLADMLERKSFTTIQKWETGIAEPSFETVVTLSEIFGIDLNDMVYKNLEYDSCKKADSISDQEKQLLESYRSLNKDGQQALLDYVEYLQSMPKFTSITKSKEA